MRDNKTSKSAAQFDDNVHKTIPRYHLFHDETLDMVKTVNPQPAAWLDTGCGTGTLVLRAAGEFDGLRFVVADPAGAMLELAREKLSGRAVDFLPVGSEELSQEAEFDVVTAIMSHHYLTAEKRVIATRNCYNALKPGGLYISFETIRPATLRGTEIGLQRWRSHQLACGKTEEDVEKHISRYDVELLPITVPEHLALLSETGFSVVEVFWASGLQAGFYAIK